jgi:ribulose-5-phosphate 4-epimerase/fuculose-1-phosphate aldolase
MAVAAIEQDMSVRDQVSAEEWKTRVDLACAYRLIAHYYVSDLTYNHLSARVPGEDGHILIKPHNIMFEEVTASNLLKYDYDGNPVTAGAPKLKGGGLIIHAGILQARADVNVVFHTHTEANMGVSSQKFGLLTVNQHAMRFHNRIAYHDFKGFEFNLFMRDPLLKDIEGRRVALLRNHGSLVLAESVPEAFVTHHFLEFACRGQIAALSAGYENLTFPDEEACEFAAAQVEKEGRSLAGGKDWPACLRMAERLYPDFRE